MTWLAIDSWNDLLDIAVRILLAVVLGGLVGWEREYRHRPAGLRTHILVCVGAALVMLISQSMVRRLGGETIDPTRLGAQVISGIGFLGAGTIIRTGVSSVKGLTTAATLWTTSCIGLAVGSGAYGIAILATLAILFALVGIRGLDARLRRQRPMRQLWIEIDGSPAILGQVTGILEQVRLPVESIEEGPAEDRISESAYLFRVRVRNPEKIRFETVFQALAGIDGLRIVYHD